MKKNLHEKTLWLSLLSATTLIIFILLAVGSGYFIPPANTVPIGKGLQQETYFNRSQKRVTTGKQDREGRWMGEVTIVYTHYGAHVEKVTMLNGKRFGLSTCIYPNGDTVKRLYALDMGEMPKYKTTESITANISAFQILGDKYPWFLFSLNGCGFDSVYVEAFMDTVETLLYTHSFEIAEFDTYYEDVLDELEETPYDSIILLNSDLFLIKGLEEIKSLELRMAVIERYWSEGSTTYNIVNTTYPGYLQTLNDSAVTNQDFEGFCQDLDSCMDSYGALAPEDTFFLDSIDARMSRALYAIMSVEDTTSSILKRSMKSTAQTYANGNFRGIYRNVSSVLQSLMLNSTPSEVGTIVVSQMLMQFIKGDILRSVVMEAYFLKKGIISIPTAATLFSNNNSATSVTLHGYVPDNGGSYLRASGIVWATFYNPTLDDNIATGATGSLDDFAVTLTGLTEGTTYYARTYATNSAGIAYGNCIEFVAATPSGINENKINAQDLTIYPNPASASATISFLVNSSESVVLTMIDMKGQVVFKYDLGRLPQGKNQIELDISAFKNGMYTCQLMDGTTKAACKLVIAH